MCIKSFHHCLFSSTLLMQEIYSSYTKRRHITKTKETIEKKERKLCFIFVMYIFFHIFFFFLVSILLIKCLCKCHVVNHQYLLIQSEYTRHTLDVLYLSRNNKDRIKQHRQVMNLSFVEEQIWHVRGDLFYLHLQEPSYIKKYR